MKARICYFNPSFHLKSVGRHLSPRWGFRMGWHVFLYTYRPAGAKHDEHYDLYLKVATWVILARLGESPMRAVVQRVKSASVKVEGELVSEIGAGVLVFLGVAHEDTATEIEYIANKVANLRIFEDEEGKMNRSLLEMGGAALVVSQFTLYGDCRKGRRPSFIKAARPELANALYEQFITALEQQNIPTQGGTFQAMMDVELVNDGPVTILLDSDKQF